MKFNGNTKCFFVCLFVCFQKKLLLDSFILSITGREITVRTRHGTNWFKNGEGVGQGCILSPCLFNLYAEYIMQNARLNGIKIAKRNINNLRYADDTTLMVKSKEELKNLLMRVKE